MDRPWSILSSVSIRSVSLISLLTLALPTTFASRSSDDLSLVKRQSLGFNTSFGDNGGSFSSDLPIACVEGCLPNLVNFLGCTTLNASDTTAGEPTASDYCSWLCGSSNYTGFTQCLNCVIANGEQDVTLNDVNEKLRQANEVSPRNAPKPSPPLSLRSLLVPRQLPRRSPPSPRTPSLSPRGQVYRAL
ncbi:hypothetical protein BD324DRAFT_246696 [Kockovaella imperatae]|uniref:RanBP2-type domain-containing protein n=1 Tax=Kockovaella imperatae TaxID=4999 RepID=A0A1Y1UPL5_9TREE|nr:hypothetical protein BD324DRAFT_246696 [Kockovaella imperatae]ORX39971.1 hypothetical protein BD324DRAFT_246696 [Kockovaella imperatae]